MRLPRSRIYNRVLILQQYENLQKELNREGANHSTEHIQFLIRESNRVLELLLAMQEEARKRKDVNRREGRRNPGRPKKTHDSNHNPLYNSPKQKKTEDEDSKRKFLAEIQGNGQTET